MIQKLFCLAAAVILVISASFVFSETSDESRIREILADYVVGWREGDAERLARVFDLDAGTVMWTSSRTGEEKLSSMTFREILARQKPRPEYGLQWRVLSLDVVDGRAAVAKLEISRKGGSYIDFLVCHKIADRWKIVNKTFAVRSDEP